MPILASRAGPTTRGNSLGRSWRDPDGSSQSRAQRGSVVPRLILDPRGFRNPVEPSLLDKQALGHLDRALNRLLAHDLAVILTPYSHGKYFISDSASAAAFARFWEALAHHVRRFDADRVFLEVANEPPLTPEAWEPLQREILAAMRRGAPRHTLITSGAS
jgi:endoglucanase